MPRANPPEKTVLVLQGGGALGSYQGGAFEALVEHDHQPDWVAGISIGAINAALIAGNPPERRVERVRTFWETVTATTKATPFQSFMHRDSYNDVSAAATMLMGIPGFFKLRTPPAAMMPKGTVGASSFYDTAPLRETLLELVDFDYLNNGPVRLSVGAVNVETGNMTWFDSKIHVILPEHIMASGALPPAFPAIKIDGAYYWDGGLVSNTPLQYILDEQMPGDDLVIFQIDVFSARGVMPASVWQIEAREKDIRFSSRTRFNTDMMRRLHNTNQAARRLFAKLPPELRDDPDAKALLVGHAVPSVAIVHLIYKQPAYEDQNKDFEFSRSSMEDHWDAGVKDVLETCTNSEWTGRDHSHKRVQVFDLTHPKIKINLRGKTGGKAE